MSLRSTPLTTGALKGTIYDFDGRGDVLPMHTHDAATVHISIVARGRFQCRGDGWEHVAEAGAVLDWQPNDPHEFVALVANSRLVNIVKS